MLSVVVREGGGGLVNIIELKTSAGIVTRVYLGTLGFNKSVSVC